MTTRKLRDIYNILSPATLMDPKIFHGGFLLSRAQQLDARSGGVISPLITSLSPRAQKTIFFHGRMGRMAPGPSLPPRNGRGARHLFKSDIGGGVHCDRGGRSGKVFVFVIRHYFFPSSFQQNYVFLSIRGEQ
ncbi:hypothetical protein TNCV_4293851 [Trichonephila clavipes]|uniref:Uncharacterized protein n=1 Tax=Trichonephila clavipes TaxID=2585209 RepID=A0A8X6RGS7_TRICX|nr:hypothetical protein TNCV_4293851 [Trichonephila clavipes]